MLLPLLAGCCTLNLVLFAHVRVYIYACHIFAAATEMLMQLLLQNAYNLPAEIQPYAIVGDGGCGAPICAISDLASFCQSPNVNGGDYCTNTDGPGPVATAGTEVFKSACPDAYSYSADDATSTNACPTGTNYNFVYCP